MQRLQAALCWVLPGLEFLYHNDYPTANERRKYISFMYPTVIEWGQAVLELDVQSRPYEARDMDH